VGSKQKAAVVAAAQIGEGSQATAGQKISKPSEPCNQAVVQRDPALVAFLAMKFPKTPNKTVPVNNAPKAPSGSLQLKITAKPGASQPIKNSGAPPVPSPALPVKPKNVTSIPSQRKPPIRSGKSSAMEDAKKVTTASAAGDVQKLTASSALQVSVLPTRSLQQRTNQVRELPKLCDAACQFPAPTNWPISECDRYETDSRNIPTSQDGKEWVRSVRSQSPWMWPPTKEMEIHFLAAANSLNHPWDHLLDKNRTAIYNVKFLEPSKKSPQVPESVVEPATIPHSNIIPATFGNMGLTTAALLASTPARPIPQKVRPLDKAPPAPVLELSGHEMFHLPVSRIAVEEFKKTGNTINIKDLSYHQRCGIVHRWFHCEVGSDSEVDDETEEMLSDYWCPVFGEKPRRQPTARLSTQRRSASNPRRKLAKRAQRKEEEERRELAEGAQQEEQEEGEAKRMSKKKNESKGNEMTGSETESCSSSEKESDGSKSGRGSDDDETPSAVKVSRKLFVEPGSPERANRQNANSSTPASDHRYPTRKKLLESVSQTSGDEIEVTEPRRRTSTDDSKKQPKKTASKKAVKEAPTSSQQRYGTPDFNFDTRSEITVDLNGRMTKSQHEAASRKRIKSLSGVAEDDSADGSGENC